MSRTPILVALAWALAAGAAQAAAGPGPQVFAPGVISGPANDDAPAFTPDGGTVFFGRSGASVSTIMVSHRKGAGWTTPQVAPFSGQWSDQQVTMAPDGSFLVFVSNRPLTPDDKAHPSGNLWKVERRGASWGPAVHLPPAVNRDNSVWAPSIAGDGSLYFISRQAAGGPLRLWRSQRHGGDYQAPTPLAFGASDTQDVDPAVAPDESFLVFSTAKAGGDAPERLVIAFREGDHWGKPVDLGDAVNGRTGANGARLGPDHKTLYFTSDRSQPIALPRERRAAAADLVRVQAWDDGLQNIWSVSLAPWLAATGQPAG